MPNSFIKNILLAVVSITLVAGCAPKMPIFDPAKATDAGSAIRGEVSVSQDNSFQPMLKPERLVYKVKWLGITAGELVSEVKGIQELRGRKAYIIEVTARTVGFCSTLYRIEDHYISYMDVERLHTLRHEVHRREGGYVKDAVTDFDQDAHKAYFKSATDGSEKTFDIPPDVQDTVTASYAARFLPLAEGRVFTFKVCNSEKVYDLFLKIGPKMLKDVPGEGVRDAFHLIPFAKINGQDVREGKASGYITADARRIPFLVVIKAPVFTAVTATVVPSKL